MSQVPNATGDAEPSSGLRELSARRPGVAWRLFLTCWLVYAMHFATNTVREIYPALALGDHFSFRLDEYANMHPDLFEKEGYGWHSGNNPGVSMVAAIPYAVARPLIDLVVEHVRELRSRSGDAEPPAYDSKWPLARGFYAKAYERGLDVKLFLGAWVMHAFCMAPSSALGVVAIFWVLRRQLGRERLALGLALLYAFGTPVFFRTGFLNHNLMLGHIAFFGFLALWSFGRWSEHSDRARYLFAGVTGGTAVLFDYSGVVVLFALFLYGIAKSVAAGGWPLAVRQGWWYFLGTLPPGLLLMLYQWRSFGHPLYPGQHWMPPVEWIDQGYQGYGPPQLELLLALAFDPRFGIFVVCPLLLLALPTAFDGLRGRDRLLLPRLEMAFVLLVFVAVWVFFSGSNYTRLQFNTGMRYLACTLPFIFLGAASTLAHWRRAPLLLLSVFSVAWAWSLAMYRDVESGFGMLNPIGHVLIGGFRLPVLDTFGNLGGIFGTFVEGGVSPLPLMLLAAAILTVIWLPRQREARDR